MRSNFHHDVVIQLFAKAPLVGRVKTRMQNRLSAEQALRLHEELLHWACHQLCAADRAAVELWVAGDVQHPFFSSISKKWKISLHQQSHGDLGAKMYAAACAGLQHKRFVILVGSDCPFVDGPYLDSAIDALYHGNNIVIGPACDGGYVLLGLNKVDRLLFDDIAWGDKNVLTQTKRRLTTLGWRYHLLAEQPDIDRPEDLPLLAAEHLPVGLRQFATFYP